MDTATISVKDFATKHGVKFECKRINARPDGLMDNDMRHFKCRVVAIGSGVKHTRSFGLYFSQGCGWTTDPTLEDVLDSLASDAISYENAHDFDDWAGEYGYDTDSRKAEKIYRTVKRQAEQLKRTLGEEAYNELLWNTERL